MISKEESELASIETARHELYAFSLYMFKKKKGYKWQRAAHHKVICEALMRVYRGECKRLIINLPPRYSKTQLMMDFAAWTMGRAPDSEFIHASYSATLAVSNSASIRDTIQHEAYRKIFPGVELASDAKSYWKTTAGGVMYATGAGGTITGFGAGKHRKGFAGCFPYEQMVETEIGAMAIGDLVIGEIPVRVWSWNEAGRYAELMPIDTFWTNPENDIIEVGLPDNSSFKCTPDHKILTSLGWIEARHFAKVFNLVNRKPGFSHCLFTRLRQICCQAYDVFRMLWSFFPFWQDIGNLAGYLRPRSPEFNVPNNLVRNAELSGNIHSGTDSDKNLNYFFIGQPASSTAGHSPMSDCIAHVVRFRSPRKIIGAIVGAVSIEVSAFKSGLFHTVKRLKDKAMDVPQSHLPINGKIDAGITLAVIAPLDGAERDCAPDVPHVRDLVKPLSVSYVNPVFIRHVDHVKVTFCLEVRGNHNFILAQSGVIVSNCVLLDDLHKADEARSDTMRNGVIEWFQNTLESRTNSPDTPIILIMQRLHELDIAGWLLGGGNGEKWDHVCIPAINADGTALWPEKHSIEDLHRMREANPYVFSGQYEQKPSPDGGGLFKADRIGLVEAMPHGNITWMRGWDFASTTTGDYTAGVRIGKLPDGRFVIADVVRLRVAPEERDDAILKTVQRDGQMVKQSFPQDPGQAGKTQILYLTKQLAGFNILSSTESGDKVTRAEPFAAQCNVGNVIMLRGAWNDAFINELRSFPNGANDDQVDAASRAFGDLIGNNLSIWASLAG